MRAAGRVVPFSLVRILNELGQEVPLGEEGEIVVKAEAQMPFFWGARHLPLPGFGTGGCTPRTSATSVRTASSASSTEPKT